MSDQKAIKCTRVELTPEQWAGLTCTNDVHIPGCDVPTLPPGELLRQLDAMGGIGAQAADVIRSLMPGAIRGMPPGEGHAGRQDLMAIARRVMAEHRDTLVALKDATSPPLGTATLLTKHYCCYGMYADVGHSSDCPVAGQDRGRP